MAETRRVQGHIQASGEVLEGLGYKETAEEVNRLVWREGGE